MTGIPMFHLHVEAHDPGKSKQGSEYILGLGRYAKRKDVSAHQVYNLPTWASGDPVGFFAMVDRYERKNGTPAMEIDASIPRDIPPDWRPRLVHDFVSKVVGDVHPAVWAIHCPDAQDGDEQPHFHLLFNERIFEGPEKPPHIAFLRATPDSIKGKPVKKSNVGGYRKSNEFRFAAQSKFKNGSGRRLRPKSTIERLRALWASICNAALRQLRSSKIVNHISYKRQGNRKMATQHIGYAAKQIQARGQTSTRAARIQPLNLKANAINLELSLAESVRPKGATVPELPNSQKPPDQVQSSMFSDQRSSFFNRDDSTNLEGNLDANDDLPQSQARKSMLWL